jgi:hypothetical protein
MKQLILLLALLSLSCSKDDIEETSSCGEITAMREQQQTPSCETGYLITTTSGSAVSTYCVDQFTFDLLEIGDRYCETSN